MSNVADDFISTPPVLDTTVEGLSAIVGTGLVVVGLPRAHRRRVDELEEVLGSRRGPG